MNHENQQSNETLKASPNSSENGKRKMIAALLAKLALHCPRADLEPSQFKLLIEDMISDLAGYSTWDIEQAIVAYRTSGERFFPNSGQLIAKINQRRDASVAAARASAPAYTAPKQLEPDRKWPFQLKPWRAILKEHGKPIPPDDSPLAQSLDALQKVPAWYKE